MSLTTTTVTAGQSLIDLAIQAGGTVEALPVLFALNSSLTGGLSQYPAAGLVLTVPVGTTAVALALAAQRRRINTSGPDATDVGGIFDDSFDDTFE